MSHVLLYNVCTELRITVWAVAFICLYVFLSFQQQVWCLFCDFISSEGFSSNLPIIDTCISIR